MNILLSAYACEPGKGSEPEVGWQWALGLARLASVTVVTRSNNKSSIESALVSSKDNYHKHLKFIYYDLPGPILALKRFGLPIKLYYILWQIGASFRIFQLKRRFDIVQHLTFNAFSLPGFLWFRRPAVVLGPLGGGMVTSSRHLRWFAPWNCVAELFRSATVVLSSWNPLLWISYAFADLILIANEDTMRRIPLIFRDKCHKLLETACPQPSSYGATNRAVNKLIWIGSMVPRKGPMIVIEAIALLLRQGHKVGLTMVGEGPLRDELQRKVAETGFASSIKFTGKLPHSAISAALGSHTALVFTSVRDTSGNVVLEAMASGIPVVAFNHQGVSEMVDSSCAYLVNPDSDPIAGFADQIRCILRNNHITCEKGRAAKRKAAGTLSWEGKWQRLLPLYKNLLLNPTSASRA